MKYILSIFYLVFVCPIFGQNCAPINFDVKNNISYVRVKNHALEIRSKKLTAVGYYPTIINDTTLLYVIPESLMKYSYADSIEYFIYGGVFTYKDDLYKASFKESVYITEYKYQLIGKEIICQKTNDNEVFFTSLSLIALLSLITQFLYKEIQKGVFKNLALSFLGVVMFYVLTYLIAMYFIEDPKMLSKLSIYLCLNLYNVIFISLFIMLWLFIYFKNSYFESND